MIERYPRREAVALIDMHLAGVSVRRVEDSVQALWPSGRKLVADAGRRADQQMTRWLER
jgi:hypothetical protein